MVDFYLQRGEIALKEAELLAQSGYYLGCVNRLYYAAFYNVSGYLFLKGFIPKSHKGVVKLFNQEVTTNTILITDDARFFHTLYEWRQEGDYGDFITFKKEEILELIINTKALIIKIKALIIKASAG